MGLLSHRSLATRGASIFALLVTAFMPAKAKGVVYEDVKEIIDSRCAGPCHNSQGPGFFLPMTTFEEIQGNDEAMLSAIEDDYMPMGGVPGFRNSSEGIALIKWLKEGTDLHGGNTPPPEHILMRDPRTLTYEDVKPIIDRNCVGCHNPNGQMARKPFNTLSGIRRERGDMWKELDRGKMPRGNNEFRFSADGRALMGWLRYGSDSRGGRTDDDDDDDDDD